MLQDDLWCGSVSSRIGEIGSDTLEELIDMGQSTGNLKISRGPSKNVSNAISRKISSESNINLESNFFELGADTSTSEQCLIVTAELRKVVKHRILLLVSQSYGHSGSGFVEFSSALSSVTMCNNDATHSPDEPAMWDCEACTFLNHPLIPICEVCRTPRPKDTSIKNRIWTCKFCTLENCMMLDNCSACD